MKTVHVIISGKVQGVFFRSKVQEKAQELGVKGLVCNNSDGTVKAVFQGSEDNVKKILNFCKNNPGFSQVEKVETKKAEGKFDSFEISY